MFFLVEKLSARLTELESMRYREEQSLFPLQVKDDERGEIGQYPSSEGEWRTVDADHHWEGHDKYLWLQTEVEFPAEWRDKDIVGRFDFGGGGVNSGFESLLFVNGEPYQGVDSNHKEVFFPGELWAGTKAKLVFRLWSGMGGLHQSVMEHCLRMARIGWLDKAADDLYFTGRAVLQVVQNLDDTRPERHALLTALDRAVLELDWSKPHSEAFYRSVEKACSLLHSELEKCEKTHAVTVTCVGHTHIDVAWLWQLKHTREKAARSFSTVLRLMERFPEYLFLQTQPQLYEYLKSDYPDLYKQISERVKDGRWEAGGAMWLEADCNLASGESLVRQLVYGIRFFQKEFGVVNTFLWLPDVFGYSWALPQILRKCGINSFMTSKISWNQYNRMPHDTFRWKGIDGSEVLTHFITTPIENEAGAERYTYNGKITARSVKGSWDEYKDKAINRDLLLPYGFGDGGGGVNREMLELRRRLDSMPGVPHVQTGRADEFFQKLQKRIAETDGYVHTWDGELYLEYHRGTYTSQAYTKKMNRKLELLYREAEWLSVLLCATQQGEGVDVYPAEKLAEGWKIILRNQFHDIIPGSSIREVYQDSRMEYAEAEQIGVKAVQEATAGISRSESDIHSASQGWTVFNGGSWHQDGLVFLPGAAADQSFVTADGSELDNQAGEGGVWVLAEKVPSIGYNVIKTENRSTSLMQPSAFQIDIDEGSVDSPIYRIEWNKQGHLTRIYDKEAMREVLEKGGRGNVLQVFEDKPASRFDAWDIDIFYQEKKQEISELLSVQTDEVGPLFAALTFTYRYMDSTIEQRMVVYANDRRIDFQTQVNWQERRQLLKAAFETAIRSTTATYDIQFGNVQRPTHWNTSWDYARFETIGHQWADLSERHYGVSLLNDCKYGYDIKNNVIRLTLIKSAIVPDPTADLGEHTFTYSLFPHQGDWYEGRTPQAAWSLNNPFIAVKGCDAGSNRLSLFHADTENVMIDAVKLAEEGDAFVVRLHEFAGRRGEVAIRSDLPLASWQECDLLEQPIDDQRSSESITTNFNPYEIKTFLVRWK
ncbi:alpha-mannosidase [Paenibacillus thalictri]|uniref:Alpha-mannosidase n=1 Tax=Paenibacillus thalictri TaxID=2527873 RepID=A0A4Q9DKP3_9BACL|nr:alpha-mannosidase [Paenibacillus thalictri]TBL75318.1 alpha-mannosidase [Paenibacillus thalictri]